jgi:hypothetical protein
MTGHAHHFLRRLDRLALPHVELALSLYNDVPILQFILDEGKVPEGAARAAICLGAPDVGPHLIVSRDGKFITALAEGMRPYDVPVVSRASLDFMARRVTALRERMKASEEVAADAGRVDAIFGRITDVGPRFSLEEYRSIAGLHPWLRKEFLKGMVGCGSACLEIRDHLTSSRRTTRANRDEVLSIGWTRWWALNHFTLLVGADRGWDLYDEFFKGSPAESDRHLPLSWTHVRIGAHAGMLRGAWLTGRIGIPNFDHYVDPYLAAPTIPILLNAGLGLMVMGLRDSSLRAQVDELLEPFDLAPDASPLQVRAHRLKGMLSQTFRADPAAQRSAVEARARRCYADVRRARGLAATCPPVEEAPRALALACYAHELGDSLNDFDGVAALASDVTTFATLEPEDFFLPRDHLDLAPPWTPRVGERLFAATRAYDRAEPVRAAPAPGRNDACACGSGKKYKRCCLGAP